MLGLYAGSAKGTECMYITLLLLLYMNIAGPFRDSAHLLLRAYSYE